MNFILFIFIELLIVHGVSQFAVAEKIRGTWRVEEIFHEGARLDQNADESVLRFFLFYKCIFDNGEHFPGLVGRCLLTFGLSNERGEAKLRSNELEFRIDSDIFIKRISIKNELDN